MSQQITTAQIRAFGTGIDMLQQQRNFRFAAAVIQDNEGIGEDKSRDQVDAVEMVDIVDRHGDTNIVTTPHKRRVVVPSAAEAADYIDRVDVRRILNNPQNMYVRNFSAAANRKKDTKVIDAFFATAKTGKDGSGSAEFDTANYSIASGSAGMTIAKLRQAREKLEAAENMEPDEDPEATWHIAMAARQRRDLLATTEVTNSDYNTVKALVQGQVNEFLGFTFHKSERLNTVSSERACPAWVRTSMWFWQHESGEAFIDVLPGKRHTVQVRYEIDCGATRLDEKGVVRILCAES